MTKERCDFITFVTIKMLVLGIELLFMIGLATKVILKA